MRIFIFILIALTSGCASWIPAAVHKLDNGVLQISTNGNVFAKEEKMRIKLEKKANKACNEKGYEYKDRGVIEWKKQKDYSTGITTSYQRLAIKVVCKP